MLELDPQINRPVFGTFEAKSLGVVYGLASARAHAHNRVVETVEVADRASMTKGKNQARDSRMEL